MAVDSDVVTRIVGKYGNIDAWLDRLPSTDTDTRERPAVTDKVLFTAEDCAVFRRYPSSVSWAEVSTPDQERFKSIRARLKELADKLAASGDPNFPLKSETSHPTPNGRSPREIWCCAFPSAVANKSYGLQIALIISGRGAEVCFCMGSGTSQIADPSKKQELEGDFALARKRLGSMSQDLVAAVDESKRRKWCYRRSWLTQPNQTDFSSLTEWLSYASSPEGSAASISVYFTPEELQTLGTGIFGVFAEALKTFGPILRAVYSSSAAHWIFQGNPNQFDVDRYVRGRQQIVWSVRQHKDRILAGDRVLIWKSGPRGGVIAECSVIGPPSTEILEDAPGLWNKEADRKSGEMRCKLRLLDSFVDAPISRTAVQAALPELSIIKASQGTNFSVTEDEYLTILALKDQTQVRNMPTPDQLLSAAETAIKDTGFQHAPGLVGRFLSALAAKPFVILTGNSGTGKTKLAQLIAHWLAGDLEESKNRYAIVPVGADWTDNRNVVGFVNHLRKDEQQHPIYQSTPVLDLLLRATAESSHPYFLILDEMNLSHVERYFSDFLSAMESKKLIPLHQESQALQTPYGAAVPREIPFPENLFVIGTVNIDETTYMFSPKVLDRANVIEFRVGDKEAADFLSKAEKPLTDTTPAIGMPVTFLNLSRRARSLAEPALELPNDSALAKCRESLQDLFGLLHETGLEFAFRTIAEITRYLQVDFALAPKKPDWRWEACMDSQVLQKLLPKLHGSRRRLEAILIALATYCEKCDATASQKPLLRDAELNSYPPANPPSEMTFPLSRTKLLEMIEAVRRDQFVSFIQ